MANTPTEIARYIVGALVPNNQDVATGALRAAPAKDRLAIIDSFREQCETPPDPELKLDGGLQSNQAQCFMANVGTSFSGLELAGGDRHPYDPAICRKVFEMQTFNSPEDEVKTAAAYGLTDKVAAAIEKSPKVNLNGALFDAAACDHRDTAAFLVDKGADIEKTAEEFAMVLALTDKTAQTLSTLAVRRALKNEQPEPLPKEGDAAERKFSNSASKEM